MVRNVIFLNIVKESLNLDNVTIINTRVEDYSKKNREVFDIVTGTSSSSIKTFVRIWNSFSKR